MSPKPLFQESYDKNEKRLESDFKNRKSDKYKYVKEALEVARKDGFNARLYKYDPKYRGYGIAVIILGKDLDEADRIVFMIPGTTHGLDTLPGLTKSGVHLYNACVDLKSEKVKRGFSVVVWMGYEAPANVGAGLSTLALAGSKRLIEDVDTIKEALAKKGKKDKGPRMTLSGHSYGSVVVGYAARKKWGASIRNSAEKNTSATWCDALILLGSPGAGVVRAAGLTFSDSVFVGSDSNDPITNLQGYGTDPAHKDFGGTRFRAVYKLKETDPRIEAHSHYYDQGSDSLKNIARIVAGEIGSVVKYPPRKCHLLPTLSPSCWWASLFPDSPLALPSS